MLLPTGAVPQAITQFSGTPLWTMSLGTMVVGAGSTGTFRFYSSDGRMLRQFAAPVRLVPITPDDAETLLAKYLEAVPPESRDILGRVLRRQPTAPQHPAYLNVKLADDGRIWAQPPTTAADLRSGRVEVYDLRQNMGLNEWHVYSASGTLQRVITVPPAFHLRRIAGNRLYGNTLNSDDEPVVQILRVPS